MDDENRVVFDIGGREYYSRASGNSTPTFAPEAGVGDPVKEELG